MHMRYRCIDLQAARSRAFARKRYNSRRMTIIQAGVDYGTFIEASSCPQRTDRWRGSRLFARVCARVSVRGGCWHWQICSWIKALCRTKSCHNAPCHCIHDLIYLRCNTQQGCNNSVDSPLRIQAYSRGTNVSGEKRQISSNRPFQIFQLVTSKRVGVSNWNQADFANILLYRESQLLHQIRVLRCTSSLDVN